MTRVLTLGIATLDHIFRVGELPDEPEKYRASAYTTAVGGCAPVAAAAIVRLGGEAAVCTRLARDATSAAIVEALAAEGIDTSRSIVADSAVAPVSSVFVTDTGDRQVVNFRGSGFADTADHLDARSLDGIDAVMLDTRWPAAAIRIAALAAERGIPTVVDAESPFDHMEPALRRATHIAFSAEGLRAMSGTGDLRAGLRHVAGIYPEAWLCVTDGGDGVYTLHNGRDGHVPAFPIVPVDTLGAGDVWHGALALALGEGRGEPDAVRFANAAAAVKCRKGSGWGALPGRDETLALLAGAPAVPVT